LFYLNTTWSTSATQEQPTQHLPAGSDEKNLPPTLLTQIAETTKPVNRHKPFQKKSFIPTKYY
jgi:hypothetical protein